TSPFCTRDSGETNNRSRDWRRCENTERPSAKVCGADADCPGSRCIPDEDFKRQQMRNLFAAIAVSPGTPLLLGGDEWMRTPLGSTAAYSTRADNSWNWFDWGVWQTRDEAHRMKDFVAQVNRFRAANIGQLGADSYDGAARLRYKSERNDESPNWGG